MSDILEPAIVGLLIGFFPAVVGGVISYFWFFRRPIQDKSGVLIFIISTSATLVVVGFIAIIAGLIGGDLEDVILMGVGVFIGFATGFGLMLLLYLRLFPSENGEIHHKKL